VDVTREPGAGIGREIAAREAVEHELDAFISHRHEQRLMSEPEREAEAAWVAAEKLQEAARRREIRAGWYGWYAHKAEIYARLSAEHAATAEGLMEATDERRTA
jgi:isopentenyldiphosphate isomerase